MEIQGRQRAPFTDRVWKEIEAAVEDVKRTCCTARGFLQVDGPWGAGLTSLSGDEQWLDASNDGPQFAAWGVQRGGPPQPGLDPDHLGRRGTFLVSSNARPVPLITSEFILGMRNVEAFDDDCQPLDITRAARAARDVALEEERLIYYGNRGARQPGLLTPNPHRLLLRQLLLHADPQHAPRVDPMLLDPTTDDLTAAELEPYLQHYAQQAGQDARVEFARRAPFPISDFNLSRAGDVAAVVQFVSHAIHALGSRGFGGPYALVLSPLVYARLHTMLIGQIPLLDHLRKLFMAGVHMAPIITPVPRENQPDLPGPEQFYGVIVNCSRSFARLVVGQDWTIAYRGTAGAGVFHRFAISSSIRLELTEPAALQALRQPRDAEGQDEGTAVASTELQSEDTSAKSG